MNKASKRPELSPEQQAAIEAIRARARKERPGSDELIDRGELDELVPHPQYLAVRALGVRMREIRGGLGDLVSLRGGARREPAFQYGCAGRYRCGDSSPTAETRPHSLTRRGAEAFSRSYLSSTVTR